MREIIQVGRDVILVGLSGMMILYYQRVTSLWPDAPVSPLSQEHDVVGSTRSFRYEVRDITWVRKPQSNCATHRIVGIPALCDL